MVPFRLAQLSPERLQQGCLQARADFYRWRSIGRRGLDPVNRGSAFMWWQFYMINSLFRREVGQRDDYPLGDESWTGELIRVRESPAPRLAPLPDVARLRLPGGAGPRTGP